MIIVAALLSFGKSLLQTQQEFTSRKKARFQYRDRALWELTLRLRCHIQSPGLRPEALRPCLSEGLPSGKIVYLLIGRSDSELDSFLRALSPAHPLLRERIPPTGSSSAFIELKCFYSSFSYLLGSDYVRLIHDHSLSREMKKKKKQGLVEYI